MSSAPWHNSSADGSRSLVPGEPQRHRDRTEISSESVTTTKTQRHQAITKPALPPRETADHADTRRCSYAGFFCRARSRPSDDGRKPLGRDTGPNSSVRDGVPPQRPALCERRPRHPSSPLNSGEWYGEAEPSRRRRVGRGESQQRRVLASGAVGLLTGDRRSSDRLSFCPQEKEIANKLSDHPLVSWRLGGSLGWVCGYVLIRVICGKYGWPW